MLLGGLELGETVVGYTRRVRRANSNDQNQTRLTAIGPIGSIGSIGGAGGLAIGLGLVDAGAHGVRCLADVYVGKSMLSLLELRMEV